MKKKIIIIGALNIVMFTFLFIMTNTKMIGVVEQNRYCHFYVKPKDYQSSEKVVASRDSKYILGNIVAMDEDSINLKEGEVNQQHINGLRENKQMIEIYIKGSKIPKNQYLITYLMNGKKYFIVMSKSELEGKVIF